MSGETKERIKLALGLLVLAVLAIAGVFSAHSCFTGGHCTGRRGRLLSDPTEAFDQGVWLVLGVLFMVALLMVGIAALRRMKGTDRRIDAYLRKRRGEREH